MASIELLWTEGEKKIQQTEVWMQPVLNRNWRGQQFVSAGAGLFSSIVLGGLGIGLQEASKLPLVPEWVVTASLILNCVNVAFNTTFNLAMVYAIVQLAPKTEFEFTNNFSKF